MFLKKIDLDYKVYYISNYIDKEQLNKMMMTPQAILMNAHNKQIPCDIINMILDYVITPNDKECFTLCVKDWCVGFNRWTTGLNYAKWYDALRLNKRKTDGKRTTIYNSFLYGRFYNKEKTHNLSYIERVNQSSELYGFEKIILIQRYNKIKKNYEMKKAMGHKLPMPDILLLNGNRILIGDNRIVKKVLTNNNIDLDTQFKHLELIRLLKRKHNIKRAILTIMLKYDDPDSFKRPQKPVFTLYQKQHIMTSFVKETEKMVVFENEKGDGKPVRKKKSNIYDWYVRSSHKDTKKEEEELKYVCRKINGFDDKEYNCFTIINENFDYNDNDIKWALYQIKMPY